MKIAVASTDGKIIDLHFGDANQFLIFKIKNGEGKFQEIREENRNSFNKSSRTLGCIY